MFRIGCLGFRSFRVLNSMFRIGRSSCRRLRMQRVFRQILRLYMPGSGCFSGIPKNS